MRRSRERRGKRQADIAAVLGTTQPTVAAWEADRTYPRSTQLRAVARAYGMKLEQVVPDEQAA